MGTARAGLGRRWPLIVGIGAITVIAIATPLVFALGNP